MAKHMLNEKEVKSWIKTFNSPDTDFKDIFLNLGKQKVKVQKLRLKTIAINMSKAVNYVDQLSMSTDMCTNKLDTLHRLYLDYKELSTAPKPSEFKLKNSVEKITESLFHFENDLKFIHDTIETLMCILTFDYEGESSFNNSIKVLAYNNMISEKEFSMLKMLSKTRNLFIHNSIIVENAMGILHSDIPMLQAVLFEIKSLYLRLVKANHFRIRLFVFDLVLKGEIEPTRIASVYDYIMVVNGVRIQEKELKMRTLKHIPMRDMMHPDEDLDYVSRKYNMYLIGLEMDYNFYPDTPEDERIDEVIKTIDEALDSGSLKDSDIDSSLIRNITLIKEELPIGKDMRLAKIKK